MSYIDRSSDDIEAIDRDEIRRIIREENPNATEGQIEEKLKQILKEFFYIVRKEAIIIDSSAYNIVECLSMTQMLARNNVALYNDLKAPLKTLLEKNMRYYADQGMPSKASDYKQCIKSLDDASDALYNIDINASSDLSDHQKRMNSQAAVSQQIRRLVGNESQ